MFKKLKRWFGSRPSFRLGPYLVSLQVSRIATTSNYGVDPWVEMNLRQALFLRDKYSFLRDLKIPVSQTNAKEVLQCFWAVVPAIDQQAREVCLRNALHQLRSVSSNPDDREQIKLEIARSDLRSGIPDRAKVLLDDPELHDELTTQLSSSDRAYGAPLLGQEWPNASRGLALRYYFAFHEYLLKGKRVLHFSPEPELSEWIRERASGLDVRYHTSNIAGSDVDLNQDITAMIVGSESYDVVICHRVLEHVLDDRTALQEIHRVLKPGCLLQISVPQSVHQPLSREWVVPDSTHNDHVRHYGCDFSARMEAAGFNVEDETWLLQRSRDELLEHRAFPLRIYNAWRRR
jgi:SAM-dependent methyltransferase